MDILDQINQDKQAQVNQDLAWMNEKSVACGPGDSREPKDFLAALQAPGLQVIAEVKKASPSKGLIRADFDPVKIATSYAQQGAACLSVLTEKSYFQGSIDDLKKIREAVSLPLLRKDFIVDLRQVRETYEMGADALLLIVASLDDLKLRALYDLAVSYGLTVLVEVHDEVELDRALQIGAQLIGVNNRNLKTFVTDLRISYQLKKKIPSDVVSVSESGIKGVQDVQGVSQSGFDAILVGETLMRQSDPGLALSNLMRGCA